MLWAAGAVFGITPGVGFSITMPERLLGFNLGSVIQDGQELNDPADAETRPSVAQIRPSDVVTELAR